MFSFWANNILAARNSSQPGRLGGDGVLLDGAGAVGGGADVGRADKKPTARRSKTKPPYSPRAGRLFEHRVRVATVFETTTITYFPKPAQRRIPLPIPPVNS